MTADNSPRPDQPGKPCRVCAFTAPGGQVVKELMGLKTKSQPPDWATLRPLLVGFRLPSGTPPSSEKQIRPGYWVKIYGRRAAEQWLYTPGMKGSRLSRLARELRPPEEIAAQVDQQSVLELRDQGEDVFQELFKLAVLGEDQAIRVLIAHAIGMVDALDDLEKYQPSKLKMLAEKHPNWPVLFSLNPQEIRRAKDRITRLGVGQKATTPRQVKQRLNPADFWTQLAAAVLEECENHQVIVPVLKALCAGARREESVAKAWRTPVKLTFYHLDPQTRIRIADWQRQCVTLPKPITTANFKDWWNVAKLCLLEFWKSCDSGGRIYDQALSKIPDRKAPKEFQKRNRAVVQVRKALRSLVGLRP